MSDPAPVCVKLCVLAPGLRAYRLDNVHQALSTYVVGQPTWFDYSCTRPGHLDGVHQPTDSCEHSFVRTQGRASAQGWRALRPVVDLSRSDKV